MAQTNAKEVANFFIRLAHEHGDPISNLKLQKLLYYAQAWNLALNDAPLFDDRIEAWVHGPVIPPVYGQYKEWAWQPIMENPDWPRLDTDTSKHLEEVFEVYGGMSAFDLERLTHSEDPWQIARKGLASDEASNNVISTADMKRFYQAAMR